MEIREALRSSLDSLSGHKLRSALTVLGVVFGVGAVIAMLSIGAGAEREALATISRLGLHNVVIRADDPESQDALREMREKSIGVSRRDAEAIRDAVPGVAQVAPKAEIDPWAVIAEGATTDAEVFGVTAAHAALSSLNLSEGRFLDPLDERDHAQVAVIGDGVRRDLFGFEPAVGRHLKVNDLWLEVVGVLASEVDASESFQGVSLGSTSTAIFIPLSTTLRKLDRDPMKAPLTEIVVRLEDAGKGRETAAVIDGLLQQLHGGADDYELVVPEALLAESRKTQRLFNLVMGCIAGISLLVGGIGIVNIMLATVLERTREIGLRRAVGAKRQDILVQFLVEAFTLSALGGLAGVVMGVVIAQVVAASAGWPTLVTASSVILATGVALAVGLISGLYPALRAADLDPIEALRWD